MLVAAALAVPLATLSAPPAYATAHFVVNSTGDGVDRTLNGSCDTTRSDRRCTLRAAIQEANATPGRDTIEVKAGIHQLSIRPSGTNGAPSGDLDITSPVTITGAGSATTVLDAGRPPAGSPPDQRGLDRLLEIHPTAGDVTLSGMTLREGYHADEGGGILHSSGGTLRLERSRVIDSYAGKHGGGIQNAGAGRVELVGSVLSGNAATQGGSAINNAAAGSLAILDRSVVSRNPGTYLPGGGAIGNQAVNLAVGSVRIVDSTVADNTATLDGAGVHNAGFGAVVVERSTIGGNSTDGEGGAVYNAGAVGPAGERASVVITGSAIAENTALLDGGGVHNNLGGTLTVTDTTFTANEAGFAGGGISNVQKGALSITGGRFTGNSAADGGGGVNTAAEDPATIAGVVFSGNSAGGDGGGGLYTDGKGPVDVRGSTFEANTAAGAGGGIGIHSGGDVTVTDSVVRGNESQAGGGGVENSGFLVGFTRVTVAGNTTTGNGGGIQNTSSGEFTLADSTVAANTGASGGGMANAPDSTLVVRDTSFRDNTARLAGGGFVNLSDGASTIENSTFAGNTAVTTGGGLYIDANADLLVANSTVFGNGAPDGGGVGHDPTQSATLVALRNTIVAGATLGESCSGPLTSQGGNLDSGDSCAFRGPGDLVNTDPDLGAITAGGVFELAATSPAVDAGVEPCARAVLNLACDIGADEFAGVPYPADRLPPVTTVEEGPADPTDLSTARFTFSGADETTPAGDLRFECSLDGSAFTGCTSGVEYRDLAVGPHTFAVQARDLRDNLGPAAAYAWTIEVPEVDTTTPLATIDLGPDDETQDTSAVFAFSANEPGATFECSLDGADLAGCTSPVTYENLAPGEHSFAVRAVNAAGAGAAARHVWTVVAPPPDTAAPDTSLLTGPDDETTAVLAAFTFSSDDPTATFECSLNGSAFAACPSGIGYAGLVVGPQTFAVRAVDAAGNADPTPVQDSWTVLDPPVALPVACGEVLLVSTRLTADLLECPGDGLVIGAPGITVDLAGHVVDGIGLGSGVRNEGWPAVTVTGGTVREFDHGVLLSRRTARNVVSDLRVERNQVSGFELVNADNGLTGNRLEGNVLVDNKVGLRLTNGTQHALIAGNTVAGGGVLVEGSSGNRLEGNRILDEAITLEGSSGNTVIGNTVAAKGDAGIALELASDGNTVTGNTVSGAAATGLLVSESAGNTLATNTVSDLSGTGIRLDSALRTAVVGNQVRGGSGGIELLESSGNRLESNATVAVAGTGIMLKGGSIANTLVGNTVSGSGSRGIAVEDEGGPGEGNLLAANVVTGNGGGGIFLAKGGHTLLGNTADGNKGYGIYAGPGTVDGGGNVARGNSEAGQCFGLTCG